MCLILDPRHGVLNANDIALEKTGLTLQQITGRSCFEIFHGTMEPPEGCPMAKSLRSGGTESGPMALEPLEAECLVSCTPVLTDQGEVEKVVHIATDITALRRAQHQVRESEERYRGLVENLQEGIWVIDAEGVTRFVNPSMAAMLGRREEEMIGRPWRSWIGRWFSRKRLSRASLTMRNRRT